ncbi:MAG: hypothetical protein HYR60_04480 [Acidobacteria bacterium]|nr:hypothetical protein [Acidobacteriota bacterium]
MTAVLLAGLVVLLAFQKGLLSGLMLLAFFWYFFYYKAVAWILGYIFAPFFWLPCRLVVPWKVRFSSHGKKHPLVKARIEQGWRLGSPSLRFFPTFQKLAGGDVR